MKKHRKHEEPIIDTTTEPGSVGEFIELLQQFPESGKLTLNGNIDIDMNEDGDGISIYPKGAFDIAPVEYYDDNEELDPELAHEAFKNVVMDGYSFGVACDDPKYLHGIRHASADSLTSCSLTSPCSEEIDFEGELLHPHQKGLLAEMRAHNMHVAECLGELHRREIAALLEYNTQCLAHFGAATNIVMCEIVDNR